MTHSIHVMSTITFVPARSENNIFEVKSIVFSIHSVALHTYSQRAQLRRSTISEPYSLRPDSHLSSYSQQSDQWTLGWRWRIVWCFYKASSLRLAIHWPQIDPLRWKPSEKDSTPRVEPSPVELITRTAYCVGPTKTCVKVPS